MVFKNYNVKIRKIVKSRKKKLPPYWAVLKKFGRIVYRGRAK
ncbi:MAG: hypothetical protein ACP5G1_01970 [Nanopusillaceae archaeon]